MGGNESFWRLNGRLDHFHNEAGGTDGPLGKVGQPADQHEICPVTFSRGEERSMKGDPGEFRSAAQEFARGPADAAGTGVRELEGPVIPGLFGWETNRC